MESLISQLDIDGLTILVTAGLKDLRLQAFAENRLIELYADDASDEKWPSGISVEEKREQQQPNSISDEEIRKTHMSEQTLEEWLDEAPDNREYLQEVMNWLNAGDKSSPVMKPITVVSQVERRIRRFNITGREYTLRVNDEDMFFHDFHTLFDELLEWLLSDFLPDDMVGIQLSMEGLDNVTFYPFSRADQITSQRLLDTVEKIVQSNTKITLRNIEIKVVRVKLPQGGGGVRLSYSSVVNFLKSKRCLVTVSGERNLCFGRCLALGICLHIKNQNEFHKLYKAKPTITSEAKQLYIKANVALGPVGLKEIQKFQASLPEYQLLVYEDNRLIFKGLRNEKQIFLLLADNHYYLIKSMTGFLCKNYFCKICLRGYNKEKNHKCYNRCYYYNSSPVCEKGDYQYCEECNRVFPSTSCYQLHKNNDSCSKYVTCPDCCKVIERACLHSHSCGLFTCGNCKKSVREGYKCFTTIPKNSKILKF